MMSGMDRHSELQQHKTAAEYRQAADEHVRTLKDFWKDFLVSGLFVLAAIVAIFACLAWFAANNRVSATGSTIGAKGPRFVLSGTQGGTAGKYDTRDNYASDSTSLAVNNLFNLNNMSADGSLSPGSAGQLQLNVRPLCNDLHDITVEMTWEISVQTSAVGTGSAADAARGYARRHRRARSRGHLPHQARAALQPARWQGQTERRSRVPGRSLHPRTAC